MKFLQGIGKFVLGAVGLLVVIIIFVVACSGDKKPTVKTKDGKTTEAVTSAKLGDTVNVGDWEYTFTNAKTAKTVKGLFGQEKPDHDQFVVMDVTVKNVGTDKCTLSERFFKLKDKEGNEYDVSSKTDNGMMLKPLNPKAKIKNSIAFEVPAGKVNDFELVATGGYSPSSSINVKLG